MTTNLPVQPGERFAEIASILARGVLRLKQAHDVADIPTPGFRMHSADIALEPVANSPLSVDTRRLTTAEDGDKT